MEHGQSLFQAAQNHPTRKDALTGYLQERVDRNEDAHKHTHKQMVLPLLQFTGLLSLSSTGVDRGHLSNQERMLRKVDDPPTSVSCCIWTLSVKLLVVFAGFPE